MSEVLISGDLHDYDIFLLLGIQGLRGKIYEPEALSPLLVDEE